LILLRLVAEMPVAEMPVATQLQRSQPDQPMKVKKLSIPLRSNIAFAIKTKTGQLSAGDEQSCARKLEKDKCAEAAFGPLKDLTCNDPDGGLEGNSIVKMLKLAVKVIAVGVGIIITGVLATAGIQYAAARGNPQAISGAKNKILAALGGLAIYLLFAALVNFLIPGGIIG
jgi:hypothetical protein